jgi:sterol desaturase/sphingolipid hydroxylase (fatty acid hydroxylase superfamily)
LTLARIQQRAPDEAVRREERRHTRSSLGVWLVMGTATTILAMEGTIAVGVESPRPGRVLGEVLLVVLAFEAYFYGVHRLLHTRTLFRRVHAVHHRSKTPTVLSALSLHPLEAGLIAGFLPAAMAAVELHVASVALASVYLSASIALAHCGYEVFPRDLARVPVVGWYVTPLVHDAHHSRVDVNYGATLNVFDRLVGTFRAPEPRPQAGAAQEARG